MWGFRRKWSEDYRLREMDFESWFHEQGIRIESLD